MTKNSIHHPGIVDYVTDAKVSVRILSASACSGCHAKRACGLADMKEKIIEIETPHPSGLKTGDQVEVEMDLRSGTRAVFFGYFMPLLVLVTTLVIAISIIPNQGLAGLISLLVLIPYYLILYLLRDRISKKTSFSIKSNNRLIA